MLDRGWPDYNYPVPLNDNRLTNYRAFLDWQRKNNGMQVERLKPGRRTKLFYAVIPQSIRTLKCETLL